MDVRCRLSLLKIPYIIFMRRTYVTNLVRRKTSYLPFCMVRRQPLVASSFRMLCTSQQEIDTFEYESNYGNIDYEAIAEGDPDKIKQLKIIQLEVDVLFQQGERVPSSLKNDHWKELLLCSSRGNRIKFLNYLWLNEVKRVNKKRKQEERNEEFVKKKEMWKQQGVEHDMTKYSLAHNSLFHRIYDVDMHRFYNYRILLAEMFGCHVVIDCSFEDYMTRREVHNCAKQLCFLFAENRGHKDPSHLVFCGVKENSYLMHKLSRHIPTMYNDDYPFYHTSKSYLDLYPRKRLVYLTPHCKEELQTYNPDDVYILGALVDRSGSEPLTLAKAKRDNIRMAKFPLDRYLQWGLGIKSLTLNQCMSIINDLRFTGDWNIALQHVPRRKLMQDPVNGYGEEEVEEKLTVKSIREQYRRNLVYDLLLKERLNLAK